MRRSFLKASLPLIGITAITSLVAGCASEGDVDRTQPGRIDKAVFSGEWYYRQTITDVPPNTGADFEGYQGEMERIRWKITEGLLIAYRAHPSLPGSENDFTKGRNDETTPVAAFAVTSHFDVKRSYNAATGEQTNVIYEDAQDRPWYERQYMRVDWSKNQIPNIQSFTEWVAAVAEAAPQEDEELTPDRRIFSEGYIDTTTRFTVEPGYCAGVTQYSNCGPATIRVRSSFLKIDKINKEFLAIDDNNKQTYEPLDYRDGVLLKDDNGKYIPSLWGSIPCTQENLSQYGYGKEECTPARMELFKKSGFFRTERDTYDREFGITKTGQVFLANRWNIWEGATKKADGSAVPHAERKTRKVIYYLNTQFPDALYPAAQELGQQFDKAFKDTVAALRLNEANGNKGVSQAELDAETAKLPAVFEVRQNSCNLKSLGSVPSTVDWANKHPDAKERATARAKRAGIELKSDLSDLTANNLEKFCTALEEITMDEKEPADRFTWQRLGDLRFSMINWVDRPQAAGPLGYGPSSADPLTGEIIHGSANVYGAGVDSYAASATEIVQVLNGDVSLDYLLNGQDIVDTIRANLDARSSSANADEAVIDTLINSLPDRDELRNMKPAAPGFQQHRLEKIRGTDIERLLVNEDIAMMDPSYVPGSAITQDVVNRASPANWALKNSPDGYEARYKRFINPKHGNTCIYLAEFADDSVIGWALERKAESATREQILAKARHDIFLGVTLHEVGHTVGLRHNFEGSSDSLNYFDDFWKIRTALPKAEWAKNKLLEYGYSTIMDYGAKFNSDIHGLGKYDYAAIKFGYGQLVETFPEGVVEVGGDTLNDYMKYQLNYEQIPQLFGNNVETMKNRLTVPYQVLVDSVREAFLNNQDPVTYEVPYRFCSDEYNGLLWCKTWDEGATQEEIVNNAIGAYRNYWYFNAFKRDRQTWTPAGYRRRIASRYFQHFSTAFQYFYFYGRYYRALGADLAKAAANGMNLLHEVIATPEPGLYCLPSQDYINSGWDPNVYEQFNNCNSSSSTINVGILDGAKPYYNGFDDEYYWDYTRVGAYWDKIMALAALTDSEARFYRVDSEADQRAFTISFYRSWKDQVLNLVDGLLLDNAAVFGGTVQNGRYVPPKSVDLTNPTGFASTTAPRLAPRNSWTVQYYGLALAMTAFNSTLDDSLDFAEYAKVSIKGSNDDRVYGVDPSDIAEFTDPRTKITYRAANTVDGRGIGFKLVKDVANYLPIYNQRRSAFIAASPTDRDYANKKSQFESAERVLSSKLEFIDDVRLFVDFFASGQD